MYNRHYVQVRNAMYFHIEHRVTYQKAKLIFYL
jgi:hypothetical protein